MNQKINCPAADLEIPNPLFYEQKYLEPDLEPSS